MVEQTNHVHVIAVFSQLEVNTHSDLELHSEVKTKKTIKSK